MSNEYYFSASANAFFPSVMKDDYIAAGSFPEDAILVNEHVYNEFAADDPPEGKMRGANKKGKPVWLDIPLPTPEQLIEQSELYKRMLIAEANQQTQLWQTQLALGIITDEDRIILTKWMLYVQKVQAVDTSAAPDIIWPEKPE